MAQGTLALFELFAKHIGDKSHDLDVATDVYKVMLVSEQVGGTPTIAPGDASPDSSDYTEVVGTNYAAGGETITISWTEAAGVATWQVTSGTITWSQHAAGPTDIKTAVIYNSSHLGANDAIGFVDMTADGTTAVSLVDGDVTLTFQPVIFTATIA